MTTNNEALLLSPEQQQALLNATAHALHTLSALKESAERFGVPPAEEFIRRLSGALGGIEEMLASAGMQPVPVYEQEISS